MAFGRLSPDQKIATGRDGIGGRIDMRGSVGSTLRRRAASESESVDGKMLGRNTVAEFKVREHVSLMRCGGLATLFALSGCGLGLQGLGAELDVDSGAEDDSSAGGTGSESGSGSGNDASVGMDGGGATPDGTAPPFDAPAGSCLASIPSGWNLVVYETGRQACPSGFASHDLVTNPVAATDACACSCSVTTPPSCTSGTLQFRFGAGNGMGSGGANGCAMPAAPFAVSGGCSPLPMPRMAGNSFVAVDPLAPTGGACTGSAGPGSASVTTTSVRTCDVGGSASDAEAICGGAAPSGFASCISVAGDSPCPSGSPFQNRLVLAASETLVCTGCTACSVTATCASPQVAFYQDATCSSQPVTVPANGTCAEANFVSTIAGLQYQAQVDASCTATAAASSFQPVSALTVCCR